MTEPLAADALAGDRLQDALKRSLAGEDYLVVAGTAYVQANLAQAAIFGLIRMLAHKNVISAEELARSMAWAYDERRVRVEESTSDGTQLWVPPVTVKARN